MLGFPPVVQIWAAICVVLTVDAVATGEFHNYFDSANFGTSSVGSARVSLHSKQLWLTRMCIGEYFYYSKIFLMNISILDNGQYWI